MDITEILKKLREPVDPQWIEQKPVFEKGKRSSTVPYLPWQSVVELLNERVGLGCWQWTVDSITVSDKKCFVAGTLTLFGDYRTLNYGGVGNEELEVSGYGDSSSNAEAQALRRAAAKAGLGWALYQKRNKTSHRQTVSSPAARPTVQPHSLKTTNPVTLEASKKWDIPIDKTRTMLRKLKEAGYLPDGKDAQLKWIDKNDIDYIKEVMVSEGLLI